MSDVPICVFLSGGVDSSLMVAKLDQAGARGLTTYTIGYDALPDYNEYEYARMVAERYPVDYRELRLTSEEVLATLEGDLPLDEPISDWVWVPLHFLSRAAHRDGFKVVLVGERAGLGTRGDAQLGEDVLNVASDRTLADHEGGGDLSVAAAARHQPQHLELPR